MVWARTSFINDNVVYEVRRFLFFWKFWATVKDTQFSIEWELHEWHLEGMRLLERRKEAVDQVNIEIKDAKSQPRDRRGIGKPFKTTWKTLKAMVRCEQSAPPEDWKKLLNPGVTMKFSVSGKANTKASVNHTNIPINSPNPQSGKTAYTLNGLSDKNIDFGADTVMEFREPKKGDSGNQNDRKALRKQLVQDNPRDDGESDGEYNKRIDHLLREKMRNDN